MRAELEAIKDAWDKDTGGGREEQRTREMCDRYVRAHPEQFEKLVGLTLEECVQVVSLFRHAAYDPAEVAAFRAMGVDPEESQWIAEVWCLHHFEPQTIGGEVKARVRLPGAVTN